MKKLLIIFIVIISTINVWGRCPIPEPYCPTVNGNITQTGNYSLFGDYSQTGNLYVTGTIDFSLLANNGSFNRANMLADLVRINQVGGITKGQPVYVNGVTGDKPQVGIASNLYHAKAHVFGVALDSGADGDLIRIHTFGETRNLNTSLLSTGLLHLGDGILQNAIPTSGAHIHVGWATKINLNTGIIEVEPDQYMHDVRATTDVDVELATGSNTTARKITIENYSGTELEYIDGSGIHGFANGTFPTFNKASGNGIKINTASPDFGWHDLLGEIRTRGIGATDPNDAVYNGANIRAYQFDVNDECWVVFHVPHDYVAGSDIFLHFHWSHNTAGVTTGTVTWGGNVTYAKGHNQASFPAEVNPTLACSASTTQYQHMICEVQISENTPGVTQIDSDNIEPDGIILVRGYLSANTMDGGAKPFLHFMDIHYQSTGIPTKNKVPNFYN